MVTFRMKVVATHTEFDFAGTEYVAVEYGYENPIKRPFIVPANVPEEVASVMQSAEQMLKIFNVAGQKKYSPRAVLCFTTDEWEHLENRPTVGEYYEVNVDDSGTIKISKDSFT